MRNINQDEEDLHVFRAFQTFFHLRRSMAIVGGNRGEANVADNLHFFIVAVR
mgnify:CR=1 FL=1